MRSDFDVTFDRVIGDLAHLGECVERPASRGGQILQTSTWLALYAELNESFLQGQKKLLGDLLVVALHHEVTRIPRQPRSDRDGNAARRVPPALSSQA